MGQNTTKDIAARLDKVAGLLSEALGADVRCGYIGNCSGIPDTPAWRDDRSWSIFLPHPGRVGTDADRIGCVRTEDLAELLPLAAAALKLARWNAARSSS